MKPIKFEGHNVVFAEDQKEYTPLPAFKAENGTVVTCWELTHEDFVKLVETKRIYLSVMTFNNPLQPVYLTANIDEVLEYKNDEKDGTTKQGT